MNKKLLIPTLGLAVLTTAGILGVSAARANDENTYPPFIQSLVDRFDLNEDEVETFFDEHKALKMEQMQQTKEEKLNQAVSDGVITQQQQDALQEKYQEMWQNRLQEKEQHKEEMQAWFEEQGIDHEALMEHMGGFGKEGLRKGFKAGFNYSQ